MSGHNGKLLLASIIAGIFLLMGCGAAVTEDEDGNQITSGPNNLSVRINSPVADGLYNRNDPELGYTITEGNDNADVPVARLQAFVFNQNETGERLGEGLAVLNLDNGSPLPTVEDGAHEIELIIWQDEARTEKWLTLVVPYGTDITPPEVNVAGFITNDDTPLLIYTINDPCFDTNSCNELVYIQASGSGTATLINERNGEPMPTLADGEYTLIIVFTDAAGNKTTKKITFVIDTTSNSIEISAIQTNDPNPLLQYTIDEPCFKETPPSCGELVTIDGREIPTRNGQELPTLDDSTTSHPYYVVEVTYTDEAGNSSTEIIKFSIDATPPVTVTIDPDSSGGDTSNPDQTDQDITAGGDTLTITGNVGEGTISFTSSETGTAFVYLDDGLVSELPVIGGQTYSVLVSGLAVGSYTVRIEAEDLLGNRSDAPLTFYFAVQDGESPVVSINSPTAGQYLSSPTPTDSWGVSVDMSVTDAVSKYNEVTLQVTLLRWDSDLGSWTSIDAMMDMGAAMAGSTDQEGNYIKTRLMADGKYRLEATATDAANNSSVTQARVFSVDTIAPTVSISAPPATEVATVTTDKPLLQFSADEEIQYGVTVDLCSLNTSECWNLETGGAGKPLEHSNGDGLENGVYTVTVGVKDRAGFAGSDSVQFTVNAGTSLLQILSPDPAKNEVIAGGKVKVRIQESGFSHAYLYLSFEGGAEAQVGDKPVGFPEPNVENFEFVSLPNNGRYTLRVEAVDGTGVHATENKYVTVIADNTKPGVDITSPGDSNMNFRSNINVPLAYLATSSTGNEITGIDVLLNGSAYDANGNPLAEASTSLGTFGSFAGGVTIHTVKVTVTNGNGSTSDSQDFIIDDSKPVVSIVSPSGTSDTDTSVLLSYNVSDPSNPNEAASWESVKLDGTEIPQRSGNTITGLNAGQTYELRVQVKDLAGNLSDVAIRSFTVKAADDEEPEEHRRGKSNCFLEAVKGDENTLRRMLDCSTDEHAGRHH